MQAQDWCPLQVPTSPAMFTQGASRCNLDHEAIPFRPDQHACHPVSMQGIACRRRHWLGLRLPAIAIWTPVHYLSGCECLTLRLQSLLLSSLPSAVICLFLPSLSSYTPVHAFIYSLVSQDTQGHWHGLSSCRALAKSHPHEVAPGSKCCITLPIGCSQACCAAGAADHDADARAEALDQDDSVPSGSRCSHMCRGAGPGSRRGPVCPQPKV